jgi:hypothetical protein
MKSGCNLLDALRRCERLGCTVARKPGTGEYIVRHQSYRPIVGNARRKDAPRVITCLVCKLEHAAKRP